MTRPVQAHGKNYVAFISLVLLVAAFANGFFISTEVLTNSLNHPPTASKTAPAGRQGVVLGETAPQPTNHVPNRLLVNFKSDPKISYKNEIAFNLPLLGKITLREAGFRSDKYPSLNSILQKQNLQGAKPLFNYADKRSTQVFNYPANNRLTDFKAELEQNNHVAQVSFDYFRTLKLTPDDPDYNLQWNFNSSDQINMPQAWDILTDNQTPSNTIGVAVIDSGVAYENYTDPNPGLCFDCWIEYDAIYCNFEPGADPSVDPPLTIECVDANAQYALNPDYSSDMFLPGLDTMDADNNAEEHPNDDLGHGTHVTSTIAQMTNNNNRFASMANLNGSNRIKIMPIKVSDRNGIIIDSQLIAGLDYIKNYNADANNAIKVKVVNMSLGSPDPNPVLASALNELYQAGVIMVAAAGNSGYNNDTETEGLSYPAAYDSTISVGATRYDRQKTAYSSFGPGLDIMAPGGQVLTTGCYTTTNTDTCAGLDQNNDQYPDGIWQTTIVGYPSEEVLIDPILLKDKNDFTAFTSPTGPPHYCLDPNAPNTSLSECGLFQGTSMATPHIAALAALILSINPNLSPDEVKNILTSTAQTNLPNYNLNQYGSGLIDAQAALQATLDSLTAATATPTPSTNPTATPTGEPTATPPPSSVDCTDLDVSQDPYTWGDEVTLTANLSNSEGVDRVQFYLIPTTGCDDYCVWPGCWTWIGQDENGADGWSITWTPPEWLEMPSDEVYFVADPWQDENTPYCTGNPSDQCGVDQCTDCRPIVSVLNPNATPTPTNTPIPTATPTPIEPYCGDHICQASEDEDEKTCYEDCCSLMVDDGDLNQDCRINNSDWGIMWNFWTQL